MGTELPPRTMDPMAAALGGRVNECARAHAHSNDGSSVPGVVSLSLVLQACRIHSPERVCSLDVGGGVPCRRYGVGHDASARAVHLNSCAYKPRGHDLIRARASF